MITPTPRPALWPLLALRFLASPSGPGLARPFLDLQAGTPGGLWLSRSAWSLAALADGFRRLHGRKPVVALPDYICNQSLWPLRQDRADLMFYPVDAATLHPCWDDFHGQTADIFVLVHYFGHANDGAGAREWCDRHGAWLVEDAAHVLMPNDGIGRWGDAVLYSPHKLVAIPDGAVLVINDSLRHGEKAVAQAVLALGGAHPHTQLWRLKRLIQSVLPAAIQRRFGGKAAPDFNYDPETVPMPQVPAPSLAGAALLARADLPGIARIRRANARSLGQAVADLAPWQPLFPVDGGGVPYRLAMRCQTPQIAGDIFARLHAAGLPVESWPDLPPESAPHSAARQLRMTLLLLPCHQDLTETELRRAYVRALGGRA